MHLIAQSQPEVKDNLEFFKELRSKLIHFKGLQGRKPATSTIFLYESLFLQEPKLKGFCTTDKELAEYLGYSVKQIQCHLKKLIRCGLVKAFLMYPQQKKILNLQLNHPDNINKLESVA